jgi:hypothetical protein
MRVFFAILAAFLSAGCGGSKAPVTQDEAPSCRCKPDQPCWPGAPEWQELRSSLTGRLERPSAVVGLKNPFAIQDRSGGTQSTGWLDAWTAAPSEYAVVAKTPADVAAAVGFARRHRLRLVIKGTGHDYLGRSSAPDSLLVWTHEMRDITVHDSFVASGCAATGPGIPAVSVGAGTRWLEAYQTVTGKHRRYVQGGGCTSVGAAGGFTQGGGFGSWSKKYGTGAAGVLEAEVVTADGRVLVASACQNQDLFWALRGGGGGTYGVVTRMTLRTHPLPTSFGLMLGSITARSDEAFKELLQRFLTFYAEALSNESWGEQVKVGGNNSLEVSMVFQGMPAAQAEEVWRPLRAWVEERPDRFTMKVATFEIPGEKMWDRDFITRNMPQAIVPDDRPDQPGTLFWWGGNQGEVATYWHAYHSRWIPLDRFQQEGAAAFASTLFEASRHWPVALHFNKGQAGASADAVQRGRETSMNPAVFRAATLALMAADRPARPGAKGPEPDRRAAEERARVDAAAKIIRAATPGTGTYLNETDYFEPDWQRELWGDNYEKLLAIKRKYDPEGLFYCHHCVGSEAWSSDGMCRGR